MTKDIGLAGIALVIALAVGVSVVAAARSFSLEIQGGALVGNDKTVRVDEGDHVILRLRSDTAGAIHLHGYDLEHALAPGEETTFGFEAFAAGRFPLTLHGDGGGHGRGALGYLEVMPR